jgi:hypothetical protein
MASIWVARNFRFGRNKVRGYVDFVNVLNNAALTTQVQTVGPSWLRPTAIQTARNARFVSRSISKCASQSARGTN